MPHASIPVFLFEHMRIHTSCARGDKRLPPIRADVTVILEVIQSISGVCHLGIIVKCQGKRFIKHFKNLSRQHDSKTTIFYSPPIICTGNTNLLQAPPFVYQTFLKELKIYLSIYLFYLFITFIFVILLILLGLSTNYCNDFINC